MGDSAEGYGWTSIVLHWVAAVLIFVLIFVGDSISASAADARRLHMTIAISGSLVLLGRVWWRLSAGHPPRPAGHGRFSYALGSAIHYLMLAAIALMFVTGPTAALTSGAGIAFLDIQIGRAAQANELIYRVAARLHGLGAALLIITVSLHVAGVLKHMFIDQDGTFDRIMVPQKTGRSDQDGEQPRGG